MAEEKIRCHWCQGDDWETDYHDNEWGTPLYDDYKHFEFLVMEVMQCGLSWTLMLKKREIFRKCFANFDFNAVAHFSDSDIERILTTEGMIKSPQKIKAIIKNASLYLEIIREYGSFSNYIWSYSKNKILVYRKHHQGKWETHNALSEKLAKDLHKRGFRYLGSIVLYSHLQACGIINDHEYSCFKFKEILPLGIVKFIGAK